MSNFDDEFAKTEKQFKMIGIFYFIIMVFFFIGMVWSLGNLEKTIKSQGGLGKSIGSFINDIKSEVK